ncbi:MAG: pyruvate kinase [Chromatiales bacterium]|nr:pyruvate kinase [Gammaproteobacteria bacterium]MBW6476786.1 pyruvate kinase [Chromatiales bacterium]
MPTSALKPAAHQRRTKIVATLGPASNSPEMVEKLLKAGVDVVRLNLSHGDHAQHREMFTLVRSTAATLGRHVAILMDLCGPKIRTGRFPDGEITLKTRQKVVVTTRDVLGQDGLIPSQYRNLHKDVNPGERILLDDGNLELAIDSIEEREIHCRVITGGVLRNHKGMNLPGSTLSVAAFSPKDREDATLAAELGADFLALSFVRNAGDIQTLRRHLDKLGSTIPIIAKIEKPEAVTNIDEIFAQVYGIMIARGDLGIELPAEQVPLIQRDLIQHARLYSKPVIVATQMLESMTNNPSPTRAEVSDVATAALAGTDAVMLSGETASGKYPLRAVNTMDKILREMESYQLKQDRFGELAPSHDASLDPQRRAIARAVLGMTGQLDIQAIVIPTHSGLTAGIIAAARPTSPCVGVSDSSEVSRRLALHWGVIPVFMSMEEQSKNWHVLSENIANHHGLIRTGNTLLLVSGFNDNPVLSEPVIKIINLAPRK